ncbi:hypothetical protein C8034_v010763 [Colletotrichum sidae]|uniref:Uncharacterized protein n=1 Tax=Colletotrichum sidae TaxID=1347389 RepID=A0A4R8TIE3_9PEZI|nr:hypothetical protein C8034_v010763 [Colletotrichum sidae]
MPFPTWFLFNTNQSSRDVGQWSLDKKSWHVQQPIEGRSAGSGPAQCLSLSAMDRSGQVRSGHPRSTSCYTIQRRESTRQCSWPCHHWTCCGAQGPTSSDPFNKASSFLIGASYFRCRQSPLSTLRVIWQRTQRQLLAAARLWSSSMQAAAHKTTCVR